MFALERGFDGIGTPFREFLIVSARPHAIGESVDFYATLRMIL